MENKKYTPKPIDVSANNIPEELLALAEVLAENVHEVWAKYRIEQGWTYGAERDDVNKKTPCLCNYSELDESEKLFDRETAFSTLKLITKLGYKITKA